jgi:uncharacterized protein YciI
MEFDSWTVIALVLRDDAPVLDAAAAGALQDAHLDHLATLHERGDVLAAGPLDDTEVRGLVIMPADPQRALELEAADPAVVAGRLEPRAMTWHVPAGAVHFARTLFPHARSDLDG